jgi:dinuclear metal center YbgI/SA1388 family protein
MSISRAELLRYCDAFLNADHINDYCPNGLQVEGRETIRKIVGGVTASQALIDAAISVNADALVVHHGYFWKGESAQIQGIKKRRLKALLGADLNLFAYHLPLDVHEIVGNNVCLAELLGFKITGALEPSAQIKVGLAGELAEPADAITLAAQIGEKLGRKVMHIAGNQEPIKTIAWCTGAAQSMIERAVDLGVDAYVSGEISEPTVHIAREAGIHYFAAGHHATERYGVQALGKHLGEKFKVDFDFIDIDNPV